MTRRHSAPLMPYSTGNGLSLMNTIVNTMIELKNVTTTPDDTGTLVG